MRPLLFSIIAVSACGSPIPDNARATVHAAALPPPTPFPDTSLGVHQLVISDAQMGEACVKTQAGIVCNQVPQSIWAMLQTSAPPVDFVWSGDSFPQCWSGAPACLGLSSTQQHPIVGHYVPMFGANMLQGFARCQSDADCISADTYNPQSEPTPTASNACPSATDELNYYHCATLSSSWPAYSTYAARYYTYVDGNGNPEKVCLPCDNSDPAIPRAQADAIETNYWSEAHPGWMLYDIDRHPIVVGGTSVMLDVSNPAVQAELLGRVQHWLNLAHYYGALSIDNVYLANNHGARYTCASGNCPPQVAFTGRRDFGSDDCYLNNANGYCDVPWRDTVLAWTGKLVAQAHALGLDAVVNVGYTGSVQTTVNHQLVPLQAIPPNDPSLNQLFANVDGVLNESGFTDAVAQSQVDGCLGSTWRYNGQYSCGTSAPVNQTRWSDYVAYMQNVQALGKPYFDKSDVPNLTTTDANDPNLQFILASHLIALGTSNHQAAVYMASTTMDPGFMGQVGYTWKDNFDPISLLLDPPVGSPCANSGIEVLSPNVFARYFTNGFVVVNANHFDTAPVAVALPSGVQPPANSTACAPGICLAGESGYVMLNGPSAVQCPAPPCVPLNGACGGALGDCCPAPGLPPGSTVCASSPDGSAPICQLYQSQSGCNGSPQPITKCPAHWRCCGTNGWECGVCT